MKRPPRLPLAATLAIAAALWAAGADARELATGLRVDLLAIGELAALDGGVDPGTDGRAFVELAAGWRPLGGPEHPLELFAALWWQRGPLLVDRVGDAQFASGIDSEDIDRIGALGALWDAGRWGLLAGKYDANAHLSVTHSNMAYMQSGMAFSPTITALPTFPLPSVGALAWARLGGGARLRANLQDGSPPEGADGLQASFDARFAAVELEAPGPAGGELALGLWGHDGQWGDRENIGGGWLQLDLPVVGRRGGEHLDLYAAAGVTPYDNDGPQAHLALGLLDHGVGPAAAGDTAGLALSGLWVDGISGAEVALELFYERPLTGWLALRPAVQWVHDPALAPGREDARLFFLWAVGSF